MSTLSFVYDIGPALPTYTLLNCHTVVLSNGRLASAASNQIKNSRKIIELLDSNLWLPFMGGWSGTNFMKWIISDALNRQCAQNMLDCCGSAEAART